MPPGKAQWHTPGAVIKCKEEVWAKIAKGSWEPPKVEVGRTITYFDNPLTYMWKQEYDHYFAYTKMFPLWDPRKSKDNTQNLSDVRENIYQQEKGKTVPVLTSLNYGRRPPIEAEDKSFNRTTATGDFYRRRGGVMRAIERKPQ